MTNFLIKTFIKDFKNTASATVRKAYGFLASIVGIICNVLLCTAKIVCGFVFGSIAMLADGINNLSDAGSSVVSLVGFKLANAPADEKHPFGHARVEYVSSLIISFIIILVGFQLVSSSISKIINKGETQASIVTIVVLAVSVVVKLWMSLFYRKTGKLIDSSTLRAGSIDSRNDVFATIAVLICSVITMTTDLNLDGYFGSAVGLFIIYSGIMLCKDTLSPLLGEPPSKDLILNLSNIIKSYPEVQGIHDLVVHNYGPKSYFASVHVEVDAKADILISHDMIDEIERKVAKKIGVQLVIHLDPVVLDDPEVEKYRTAVITAISNIDQTLNMHDFRAVLGNTHNNLIFDIVLPPKYPLCPEEIKEKIQTHINECFENCYIVISFDHDYTGMNGAL